MDRAVPPLPSAFGFLAYRNFDGHGAHFLDWYVPTTAAEGASFFASRDADGKHVVIVGINLSPDAALSADVDLGSCGTVAKSRSYVYGQGANAFTPSAPVDGGPGRTIQRTLPPWSITVIDVDLRGAGAPAP